MKIANVIVTQVIRHLMSSIKLFKRFLLFAAGAFSSSSFEASSSSSSSSDEQNNNDQLGEKPTTIKRRRSELDTNQEPKLKQLVEVHKRIQTKNKLNYMHAVREDRRKFSSVCYMYIILTSSSSAGRSRRALISADALGTFFAQTRN